MLAAPLTPKAHLFAYPVDVRVLLDPLGRPVGLEGLLCLRPFGGGDRNEVGRRAPSLDQVISYLVDIETEVLARFLVG
ncbi:MAG: hypothetical protein ACT4OP_02075, partial [Actinomycetota bacterium]